MQKVGIMSMQRICNYGSSLQSYGLRRAIQDIAPECQISFIDFRPGPVLGSYMNRGGRHRNRIGRAASKAIEYSRLEGSLRDRASFISYKSMYAHRYFPKLGIPKNPVHSTAVDLQFIGSDEVFNCMQSNSLVGYTRDLFGHETGAKRLVSYAASFGNTTLRKIDRSGIREELTEDLRCFDAISVRDRNSADIVEAMLGVRPPIHIDPVLLYDYMECEELSRGARPPKQKYIIVYAYAGRFTEQENSAIRDYARGVGAELISIGGLNGCCDRFINCSPFDLFSLFLSSQAVITDTYHGTIFAMITGRPFVTIVRPSEGQSYGNEEKLGDLLGMFAATHRQWLPEVGSLGDLLAGDVELTGFQRRLEHERTKATEYLRACISTDGQVGTR